MKNHFKKCFIQAYGAPLLWESMQTVFGYHNHTWRYGQNWPLAYSNAQKSATVNHMTCLVHLRLYSFISTCSSSWMIHRRWWPRRLPSSLWSSYFFIFPSDIELSTFSYFFVGTFVFIKLIISFSIVGGIRDISGIITKLSTKSIFYEWREKLN